MKRLLLAPIALLAFAVPASAETVAFNSSGTFSNVSGCISNCPVAAGNTLTLPGLGTNQIVANNIVNSVDANPTANNVLLASLTWTNNSISPLFGANSNVNYNLALNFTSPNVTGGTSTYELNVSSTFLAGEWAFGFSAADTADLFSTINLAGVAISDIHFEATNSLFLSGLNKWYVGEHHTGTLGLYADFTDTTPTAAVPEPSTWAMMILGFCGIAFMANKRRREGRPFRLA